MKHTFHLLIAVYLCACSLVPQHRTHGLSARFTVETMLQNPMLINGHAAEPEEWEASVYARLDAGACSATLIGQRVLLIVAHCVKEGEQISFSAHANNYRATCSQHPKYATKKGNITADWALCLVERPVTGVLFESLGIRQKLTIGEEVTLSGYGCTQAGGGGGNDGIFRIGKAYVEGLPYKTDFDVVTRGGAAICFGDSGGAAYLIKDDKRVIFAVNSRGNIETMSYLPSISVPQFVNWATEWAKQANNVKICGLHTNALYCRNSDITNRPNGETKNVSTVKRRRGEKI